MSVKTYQEMLGEFFRESGVLAGTFGVLDALLGNFYASHPKFIPVTLIISFGLYTIGMVVEVQRRKPPEPKVKKPK